MKDSIMNDENFSNKDLPKNSPRKKKNTNLQKEVAMRLSLADAKRYRGSAERNSMPEANEETR